MSTSSYTVKYTYLTVWVVDSHTVCRESLEGGNIGEFGESSVIRQTKTIQISTYIE